jgi:predicted NAD-dependent protein-ADP-ribosyltransferase YbiA (DUF1768 family)
MVKSILDKTVTYNESRKLDPTDVDFDANLYETDMYKTKVVFALGPPKYTFIDNNIVYYSIYLVENDAIKMNIGVYEIVAGEEPNIVDEEGDIDLNKFDKPLMFSFAYEAIHGESPEVIVIEDASVAAPKASASVAAPKASASVAAPAKSTTMAKTKTNLWIQKFMHDANYNIIDTKYDGNCFFSMVQLALEENGQEMSIAEMREILAQNATQELFENYKFLYDETKERETILSREIKNITGRHNSLVATMKKTKDRNLSLSYEKQMTEMEKTHADLKNQRKMVGTNIKDFEFMKGIDNLSMLKLKFKTSEFWADTWAISTLERELNIKIIIFSEINYKEGDIINVLQCGQLNDAKLEERGVFEPTFYLLAAHHGGYHYQLITYNQEKSFTFAELPKAVKSLVVDKCLEKIAGPYSLIPEFLEEKAQAQAGEAQAGEAQAGEAQAQAPPQAQAAEETASDLYDSATVFRFYSKSNSKPFPGKGEGEHLGPEGRAAYETLAKIPEWRRKLANSWKAEFVLDKHRWASVEHYYQANKFKRNNPDFYIQFSLDSQNSEIAKDPALAKAAGGKAGTILESVEGKKKTVHLRPKNVIIDPDFFVITQGSKYSRGEMVMEAAMREKFTQHPDLKALLIATQKAKLEHVRSAKPAEVFNDLMRVRRDLRQV